MPHGSDSTWCGCLTVWRASRSLIMSRSIHVAANAFPSFSWLSHIPLCLWTTSSLSTPLLMDTEVVSTSWLWFRVLQCTMEYMCLFKSWFSPDGCPEVGLLDQMVILFLVFWGHSILFSIMAAPIDIPTDSVLGFLFLHSLSVICLQTFGWWPKPLKGEV